MSSTTGPGLDLAALRQLRHARQAEDDHTVLLERISAHIEEHAGYLAFSGGKDSLVVLHLARQVAPDVPVVWFDSGLEFPEHRRFIEELADRWDLNLTTIEASPTALEVLRASGEWDHDREDEPFQMRLWKAIIGSPSATAHALFGPGELWGVRAAEAQSRRHLYRTSLAREIRTHCPRGCCPTSDGRPTTAQRERHGGTIRRLDGTIAYGPIWSWPTAKVWAYLSRHGIPTTPVYTTLEHLGVPEQQMRVSTVLSPIGLGTGRITRLRTGWPQLYADLLRDLPRLAEFV